MINQSTCEHVILKPDLDIVLVLEFQIQLLEALVTCRQCEAHYRIQAIDRESNTMLYQLNRLSSKHAKQTLRSVSRGSCSINRAKDEIAYLKSQSGPCERLLISHSGEFTETIENTLVGSQTYKLETKEKNFDGQWLRLIKASERTH